MEAEGKPVKIGHLQRYATDIAMQEDAQFYSRATPTGKTVVVAGAGPAGLACAHRLAMHGHDVTILEAKPKPGGLSEYGIASYKATGGFAQREVDYILKIGGIKIESGKTLGKDISLADLTKKYDAVFLGLGLAGVNALQTGGEEAAGVRDAVEFIAELRQAKDLSKLPIGRRVIVIGGGMTAIDAAIQSKLLGAEEVTICYRRGQEFMNASDYEQELAAAKGVNIRHWVIPKRVLTEKGKVTGIELEYTSLKDGKLVGLGHTMTLAADQIFKAIGQTFEDEPASGIALEGGRIRVDGTMRTSNPKVWAGGDCVFGGDDLTVTAAAHGRDAAEAINNVLAAHG